MIYLTFFYFFNNFINKPSDFQRDLLSSIFAFPNRFKQSYML